MRPATVVLALEMALDVAAARRLHDYGNLDDSGVARALEQMRVQRYGRVSLPVPLQRIARLAAIVESGEDVRVADLLGDEASLLADLTAVWPARHGQTVDWAGDAAGIIAARAFVHEVCVAQGLRDWPRIALIDCIDPLASPRPQGTAEIEADLLLLHHRQPVAHGSASLLSQAAARYRFWLRWQFCQGQLTAAGRARREHSLDQRLALQTAPQTTAAHG